MATVVITFFLFVQFYVCNMDADYIENQRDQLLSRREKRWSMNSQRVEEIVAELMRPISSDARRHFDTDLAALLEEYLTEAGLHALDAGEDAAPPNYPELALLLQQSATIYGRKVDFLYQHVMDVSEALHANEMHAEADTAGADVAATPTPAARANPRAVAPRDDFARTGSQYDASKFAREPSARRPHPTLPRFFMELEPRVGSDSSWQALRDHDGELVGLLDDFQANMEQDPHSGMLVDDWFDGRADGESQGPPAISILELQAAIDAAAPPPLASPPSSPLRTSTPLPLPRDSLDATDASTAATDVSAAATDASAEPDTSAVCDAIAELTLGPPAKKERKRQRSVIRIGDIFEDVRLIVSEDLRKELDENRNFSIPTAWIRKEVKKRMSHILSERRLLRPLELDPQESKRRRACGTATSDGAEEGGGCDSGADSSADGVVARFAEFAGWSATEAAEAAARLKPRAGEPDSEDDGFFEQSSVGDGSDAARLEDAARDGPAWAAWQAGVVRDAAAAQARGGLDVRARGRDVMRALPGAAPAHFADVLRRSARAPQDVSHLLLAALFLANAGEVHLLPGAPLSLDDFSLQRAEPAERLDSEPEER